MLYLTIFKSAKIFFVFIAVNLALNPLNNDKVFDGYMTTGRGISAATVNLNGTFIVNAFIIHTSMNKSKYKSQHFKKETSCTTASSISILIF